MYKETGATNVFEIDFKLIPSLNSSRGKKWSWYDGVKDRIFEAVENQMQYMTIMDKCIIEFKEYSTHPSDYGNLAWGIKYLLDAVRNQCSKQIVNGVTSMVVWQKRLIHDDSPRYVVDCKLKRIKVKKKADRKYVFIMREVE